MRDWARYRLAMLRASNDLLPHWLRSARGSDEIERRDVNLQICQIGNFDRFKYFNEAVCSPLRPCKLRFQPVQPVAMIQPFLHLAEPLADQHDALRRALGSLLCRASRVSRVLERWPKFSRAFPLLCPSRDSRLVSARNSRVLERVAWPFSPCRLLSLGFAVSSHFGLSQERVLSIGGVWGQPAPR